MNHSFKKILVVGLAITMLTISSLCAKNKSHDKEDQIVGVWTFKLETALANPSSVHGVITFNADGSLVAHSSFDLKQPNFTDNEMNPDTGNFSTVAMGLWKRTGKCSYEFLDTQVFTVPVNDQIDPGCDVNLANARLVNRSDITLSNDGKSFSGVGIEMLFPLLASACLEEGSALTTSTIVGCKLSFCVTRETA